ncbi:MAG: hypothetical protein J1F01_05510 [Oscillospiraceae bacterium]|nr:hypothetical protein [Oscillospiraceae bacterium]
MAREKPAYRDNLELLNERFPNKVLISFAELVRFFGLNRKTVRKWLDEHDIEGNYFSIATLARAMS